MSSVEAFLASMPVFSAVTSEVAAAEIQPESQPPPLPELEHPLPQSLPLRWAGRGITRSQSRCTTEFFGQQLGLSAEALEKILAEHTIPHLRPASCALTHKGQFADALPMHQTRTVRVRNGRAGGGDGGDGGGCDAPGVTEEGGIWFLKKVDAGLSTGVSVHGSFGEALTYAQRARSTGLWMQCGGNWAAEYVLQAAVPSPWLWRGRKAHFRVYLLALSPAAPATAARLRAALLQQPTGLVGAPVQDLGAVQEQEQEEAAMVAAGLLETRWFVSEHVWMAAAPDSWSSESTERDTQLSIHRTVELRDSGHHAELWPVLRDYAASFAADAQRCCLYVLRQNTRTANSVTVPVELDLTTDCHLGCKPLS